MRISGGNQKHARSRVGCQPRQRNNSIHLISYSDLCPSNFSAQTRSSICHQLILRIFCSSFLSAAGMSSHSKETSWMRSIGIRRSRSEEHTSELQSPYV